MQSHSSSSEKMFLLKTMHFLVLSLVVYSCTLNWVEANSGSGDNSKGALVINALSKEAVGGTSNMGSLHPAVNPTEFTKARQLCKQFFPGTYTQSTGIRFKKSPFGEEGIRFKKFSPFADEGIRFKKSPFDDEGIRFKKSPFDDEGIRFKKSPFDEEGIRFKKSPFDEEGIRFKKSSPFENEGIRF